MSAKSYYVYIMASRSGVLYIGVTNDILRRVWQHKTGTGSQFMKKYNITTLVYLGETNDVLAAIAREKQFKGWTRARKVALIRTVNPFWLDISAEWFEASAQPISEPPAVSLTSPESKCHG